MTSIAQLGIEAQSTGVRESTTELNQLTGAAARAERAVDGFEAASQGASGAAAAAAAAYARQGAAAQVASRQVGLMAVAANQNAARMSGSFSGLAAQFQDIGVTAAMGMNPMLIALQQGTQIAGAMEMAMQGGARASSVFAAAFGALLSPVAIASIALTALAATLLQMVNWSKLAAAALNGLADILELIAPYAVAAAAGLALIYAPAIVGGIISLIALLGRLLTQILAVAAAFAVANPAAAFVLGLVAAVAAMNIFRDELANIFGRDIVADAKNGANFIIGAFVGGFNAIKAAWSTLPAVIGDLVYSAADATVKGVESMINKVIDMINNFVKGAYDSIRSLADLAGIEMSAYQGIGKVSLGGVSNPYAGAYDNASAAVSQAMSDAQSVDYVGKAYDIVGKAASTAADKIRGLATGLTSADVAAKKSGASAEQAADKYKEIVDGANRTIASLEAERNAVGLSAEAAARLKYETQLLNEAKEKGITLTSAQRAELSGLATVMAQTEAQTAAAKANLELAKTSATGFLSTLRQGLVSGEGWWKSFGNAALSVFDKIASAAETSLVNALFSSSSPGGFNILSAIFGGTAKTSFNPATAVPGLWDEGGYTGQGNKNQVAGLVHAGEYVVPKRTVDAVGVGNIESMFRGYAEGGLGRKNGARRAVSSSSARGARGGSRDQIDITLKDDSGRMAGIADQIFETKSGAVVKVAVKQSTKAVRGQVTGWVREDQMRYG